MRNCVNPKSDIEKHLQNIFENGFETTLRSKADVLLNFEKGNFQFFAYFWARKKLTVKAIQSVQKSLNPKLVMLSVSEKGFAAIQ